MKHEGVETFSVLSGAFGIDWNSAFRAVVLSGSEASLPGVETAMSIEFASGTGLASVFTPALVARGKNAQERSADHMSCGPCDSIWVGRRDRARGEPKEILVDR